MTFQELISKALPGASEAEIDFVLWNRTPFPFDPRPRVLFKRASGYRRACANGVVLCELCSRTTRPGKWTCQRCDDALASR